MSERRSAPGNPRRALVLGSGGVLGFAWLLGALSAVEAVEGFDARDVDLVVGTSAGSVAAALLACRLPVGVISRHHQGEPAGDDPVLDYDYTSATGEALPPRPGMRPGSPRLVLGGLRARRRVSPIVALAGLLPSGRGTLQPVHDLVAGVADAAGFADAWPTAPRPWVIATDYRSGDRVIFGREAAPPPADGTEPTMRQAALADAVMASCSIPAWYPPTFIDGVPYIDGGTRSNCSLDLLDPATVDEVFVLAPMASLEADRPQRRVERAERWVRRMITRRILTDAAALRAAGVRVSLLTPGPTDLAAMGINMMDPARRAEVFDTARSTAAAQLHARPGAGLGWVGQAVATRGRR